VAVKKKSFTAPPFTCGRRKILLCFSVNRLSKHDIRRVRNISQKRNHSLHNVGQRTFGCTSYSPRTAERTLTNDSGEFYEKLFHLDLNTLNATCISARILGSDYLKIYRSEKKTSSSDFNVSPCIFQFNNWWIPTQALFHIQHCISL